MINHKINHKITLLLQSLTMSMDIHNSNLIFTDIYRYSAYGASFTVGRCHHFAIDDSFALPWTGYLILYFLIDFLRNVKQELLL